MTIRGKKFLLENFLLAVLAVCILLMLCGCQEEETPEIQAMESPVPIQEIIPEETENGPDLPEWFSLPYEANSSLDPILCPDGMQQVVGTLLYEGLFRLDYNFEPVPWLCDHYDRSADCTQYTFTLREGILFADGSPLTAADVRNSLERARDSMRYAQRLRQIAWIYIEGSTVTIQLTEPNSGFPALLDIPVCRQTASVPLGTGPYTYLWEEYGSWLVSNPYWWRGEPRPVERIRLDESQNAMLYRFASRDVHLISTSLIGSGEIPAGVVGEIRCQDAPDTVFQYLACSASSGVMQNAAFRRALLIGINREELVSAFLSGHALASQFPVSPASHLYPADLETAYSPFTFASALKESGYTPERTLTLLVNTENSFKVSAAQSIAQTFTDAGVPMQVRALDWDAYQAALYSGSYDLCYCETRLTADWNFAPLFSDSPLNTGGWWDGWTLSLLEQFAAADDRAAAMRALCEACNTQAFILPVCFASRSVFSHADVVENLLPTAALPFYNLSSCRIHVRSTENTDTLQG